MKEGEKFSAAIRIYHWLNALTIIAIILTVVTRKAWLEKFKIGEIILDFAHKHDIIISQETAFQLSKIIRNEIWNFHYSLGIFLALLLIFRAILLLFPDGRRIFKEGLSVFSKVKAKRASVKFIYFIVYITLFVAISTGLLTYFHKELGINHDFKEAMKALHVGIVTIIIYFVPLHFIGVIMGELGNDKGIVSKMINGG